MPGLMRIYGRTAMLIGMTGVVLTPVCLVGVWRAERRLTARTIDVVRFTKSAKKYVEGRIELARSVLNGTNDKINSLSSESERLAKNPETSKEVVPKLKVLNKDIKGKLEQTIDLVSSIQMSVRSIGNALLLFDSLPSLSSAGADRKRENDGSMKEMSKSLGETADLLGQLLDHLNRMEMNERVTETDVRELNGLVVRLKEKLRQARRWMKLLDASTDDTERHLLMLEWHVLYWTKVLAGTFTLLLVCFCFSQIHLILHGRSFLLSSSESRRGDDSREI